MRRFGKGIIGWTLSAVMSLGIISAIGLPAEAAGKTEYVKDAAEFSAAIDNTDVDHIVITQSFDVDCKTASNANGTSAFTVPARNMIIEGVNSDITLKRVCAEGASNGSLQSILAIKGDGTYDNVQVSLRNLTLDGGADYGEYTGFDRISRSTGGVSGRSIVDVYYKGTLNLEDGLIIQNGKCTYSLASVNGSAGSMRYGGGVRVDWDTETGGGTVNVKAGATIKDCVADGYGGGIGAYSYSYLNVYGGTIDNCGSHYGGAVGCTYRSGKPSSSAGTFKMYGGIISNCFAVKGGGISADGAVSCENYLLGGTIENCTAEYGGAVSLGGDGDGCPYFSIAPYSEDGPVFINNCKSTNETTTPDTEVNGQKIGYSGLDLGPAKNIEVENETKSVIFVAQNGSEEAFSVLTIKKGATLGESFPGNPTWDEMQFLSWNTKADGTGDEFTKDSIVNDDITVYGIWNLYDVDIPEAVSGLVYNQKEQKGIDKYNGDETTFVLKNGKVTGTDAGEYSAVFTITDPKYKWSDGSRKDKKVTWKIEKCDRELPDGLSAINESEYSLNDGKITGLTSEMEYSTDSKTWIKVSDDVKDGTLKSLTPGEYYVRYSENDNYFASQIVTINICAAEKPEEITEDTKVEEPVVASDDPDITKTISYAENITVEKKTQIIKKTNTDKKDIAGSTQKYLYLKPAKVKKTSIKLSWKKIKGADGYIIYGSKCGTQMSMIKKITKPSVKSYIIKKLKKNQYYKYVVVAYKNTSEGPKVITTSKSVHIATLGGSKGNPTGIKVKKSKVTLKKGKTSKIKATLSKKKKVHTHIAKFRYESLNPKVATVDKNGKIKGVKKGKTTILIYAQNGVMKKVKVTVK